MVKAKGHKQCVGKPIDIGRATVELREWCANKENRSLLLEAPRSEAEAELSGTDVLAARGAASSLNRMWIWYSNEGSNLVLTGSAQGWDRLFDALECGYWFIRIFARAFDLSTPEKRRSTLRSNYGGIVIAHALSARAWDMADWTARRMIRSPEDGAFGRLDVTPFEPAMVRLHELAYGRDATAWSAGFELGAYGEMFASWDSEEAFARSIRNVCDFHLASVDVPNGYGAFERGGYKLFPVDVLAIDAVRERLGLPMPKIEHPLLSTPLASPPPPNSRTPAPRDELVQRIVAKAESVFGGL